MELSGGTPHTVSAINTALTGVTQNITSNVNTVLVEKTAENNTELTGVTPKIDPKNQVRDLTKNSDNGFQS